MVTVLATNLISRASATLPWFVTNQRCDPPEIFIHDSTFTKVFRSFQIFFPINFCLFCFLGFFFKQKMRMKRMYFRLYSLESCFLERSKYKGQGSKVWSQFLDEKDNLICGALVNSGTSCHPGRTHFYNDDISRLSWFSVSVNI